MTKKIRVHVVAYRDCKNLVLRYRDPDTGKQHRTAKYRDPQTGEETEAGTNRKEARKLAALWEADLNAGRDQGAYAISWGAFRLRYEDEAVPALADRTGGKIGTAFNAVPGAVASDREVYFNSDGALIAGNETVLETVGPQRAGFIISNTEGGGDQFYMLQITP